MYDDPHDVDCVDFFDWLNTLDDEQHHAVYVELCKLVAELSVCVTQQPHSAQDFLHLLARVNPRISLN